ncbi:MAG: [citrate (pro-3S)-lyase] ligase [Spirochaetes bacterium]|nr:[citrate (pro-3S)-lyase] ligase [Spirochaetota bacterium]
MAETFLQSQGLRLEEDVEYTVVAVEGDRVVGTGSLSGKVLKCIAVEPALQGQGIASQILSELVHEAFRRGRDHLFLFTRPENETVFTPMGFSVVERMEKDLVLLENRANGFVQYLVALRNHREEVGVSGSVVVNCNPFTLGHRYLLEYAASRVHTLHVFVVEEDRSVFPTEVRFKLVQEGTQDINNIKLHRGGPYIISSATFPSYFLKEPSEGTRLYGRFDATIFGKRICPVLNITRRFVGEEPYCPVTSIYNQCLYDILPKYGVQVEIIPRLEKGGKAVSASTVRKLLSEGRWRETKDLVPPTTFEFLQSEEARPILDRLKKAPNSRH